MSATQCTELLKSLMVAGLLFIGLVWSFPKAVIHSPLKLQGLNFPILEQYHNKGDPTGFLIWTTCKPIRLEMGVTGNIFKEPLKMEPILTESCIKQVEGRSPTQKTHCL